MATAETMDAHEKDAQQWAERVRKGLEELRELDARARTARVVKSGVALQRKSVLATLDGFEKYQSRAEDRLAKLAQGSKYVPAEGKTAVNEWIGLAKKSRREFKKSATKSYDLVMKYIDRLESKS
jgi:hypothetical protein